VRSVFGRPMRFASRDAGELFIARHYHRFSGQDICPTPLPQVPRDYDQRLRAVRRRRHLTKRRWLDALVPPGRPSSINGNRESERRRPFYGSAFLNSKARLHGKSTLRRLRGPIPPALPVSNQKVSCS
jgi:hypothetical protein